MSNKINKYPEGSPEYVQLASFRGIVANRPSFKVHMNKVNDYFVTLNDKIELMVSEVITEQGYDGFCEAMREKMVKATIIPNDFLLEEFTVEEFGVGIELLAEMATPVVINGSSSRILSLKNRNVLL